MNGPRWFKAEEKNCLNGVSDSVKLNKPYMTTKWDHDGLSGEYILGESGRELYILVRGDLGCEFLNKGTWTECDGEGNELQRK